MHVGRNAIDVGMPRRRSHVHVAIVSAVKRLSSPQQAVHDSQQTFIIEQREEEIAVVLDKRTHNIAFFAIEIGATPITAE